MKSAKTDGYDVFLSYQRNAADFVRPIAEALLSIGVKAWFNEYEILIDGQDAFWDKIEDGLKHSKHLIYFSDKRYAGRDCCIREIEGFPLASRPGLGIVLEPNDLWVGRERPPHGQYVMRSDDPREAWSQVCKFLGVAEADHPGVLANSEGRQTVGPIEFKYHGVTFEAPGWHAVRGSSGDDEKDLMLGEFRCEHSDYEATLRLQVADVNSQGRLPFLTGEDDDFAAFDETLRFAGQHRMIDGHAATCIGTHVLMHSGYRHAAVTYCDGRDENRIIRKYSVVLPSLYSTYAEFHVTFVFRGRLPVFRRVVHGVDTLVRSIRWEANATGRRSFSPEFVRKSDRMQLAAAGYLEGLPAPNARQGSAMHLLVLCGMVASACGGKRMGGRLYRRAWRLDPGNEAAVIRLLGVHMRLGEHPIAVRYAIRHYVFHRSREHMSRVLGLLQAFVGMASAAERRQRVDYALRKIQELNLLSPYSELPYMGSAYCKARRGESEAAWMADLQKAREILRLRKFARKGVPQSESLIEEYLDPCLRMCRECVLPGGSASEHPEVRAKEEPLATGMRQRTGVNDRSIVPPPDQGRRQIPSPPVLTHPRHYEQVSRRAPGEKCPLKLIRTSSEGGLVELVYRWGLPLSDNEADALDTRLRAYIACAIYDAATAAGLSCQAGAPLGQRPAWHMEGEPIPVSLVNAGFDVTDKTCFVQIGAGMVNPARGRIGGRHWKKLESGFKTLFSELQV